MGERTPRRNNNIILSAEQLDHNASMARDLNKRASNRLRLHHGSIDGHQTANLNSLDYEMRRLKNELREITNNSGTLVKTGETMTRQTTQSKTGLDTTRRTRKSKRMASGRNTAKEKDSYSSRNIVADGNTATLSHQNSISSRRKSLSLPTLPSMTSTVTFSPRDLPQLSPRSGLERIEDSQEESLSSTELPSTKGTRRKQQSHTRQMSLESTALPSQTTERKISVSITDTNGETKLRPVSPRGNAKEDPSLATINLEAVKDRIQNRLSQPANHEEDDDDFDPDITPYMHVPPDGLPRTVYLLPPLTDLLKEAKKARYVRRPKKPLQEMEWDDPDRELDIDEIFSKKG